MPGPPPGTALAVQVLAGNDIPRKPGCETKPPIAVIIDVGAATANGATLVATLTNYTADRLSLQNSVVLDLGPNVQAANVQVTAGSAVIQGNQVVWNHFSLDSGEQASVTISLVVASGGSVVAAGAPLLRDMRVEAVDEQSGEPVLEQAGAAGPAVSSLAVAPAVASVALPQAAAAVSAAGGAAVSAPTAAVSSVATSPSLPVSGGVPASAAAIPSGAAGASAAILTSQAGAQTAVRPGAAVTSAGAPAAPAPQLPAMGNGGLLAEPAGGGLDVWLLVLALALLSGGWLACLGLRQK